MVGLATDKSSRFREFLKKYLMAILNVDELFDRIDKIRKDPVDAKTYKVDPNFDMTKPF